EDDDDVFEDLGGLEFEETEVDPAPGAVDIAGEEHDDEQCERDGQQRPGEIAEGAVIETGGDKERRRRKSEPDQLALEEEGVVAVAGAGEHGRGGVDDHGADQEQQADDDDQGLVEFTRFVHRDFPAANWATASLNLSPRSSKSR